MKRTRMKLLIGLCLGAVALVAEDAPAAVKEAGHQHKHGKKRAGLPGQLLQGA